MKTTDARRKAAVFLVAAFAAFAVGGPASAQSDVHRYLRWKRNGQLDYRRLLQRYECVSSFASCGQRYGYPYSSNGGLRQPRYFYRDTPDGVVIDGPYYVGSPYDLIF